MIITKFTPMKFFISILIFSAQTSFAQGNYFAIITNPQVGSQLAAENLIEVVNDINVSESISFVVVLGNLTANGKFDEFIWAQEILDGLTIPYSVIGGEVDYNLSEGKGSEISLLWDKGNIFFETSAYSLLFINTIQPKYPQKKYIDVETINEVGEISSKSHSNKVITFSYYPLNLTINNQKFIENILNKKLFSFVSEAGTTRDLKSIFEGLYLNRKETWGYLLVSTIKDSIQIKKILKDEIKKKTKPEVVKLKFSKPLLLESETSSSFAKDENTLWSVSSGKSISKGSVYSDNKIFITYKDGSISCLNKNGENKWLTETNKKLIDSPIIENEVLITVSVDGDLFTINTNTGSVIQSISMGEKITSGIAIVEIVEAGNNSRAIAVGTQYGNLHCYDLFSLNPIWSQQLGEMDESLQIVSEINYSDKKIFVQDNRGSLYCLSANNGMLIWKITASQGGWIANQNKSGFEKNNNLIVKNNYLYLIDGDGNLFCVDALLGKPEWNLKKINSKEISFENLKGDLLLPTAKNNIAIISLSPGKVTSEIELPSLGSDDSITDLIVIGDKIITGFSNGWVYISKPKQKFEKLFRKGTSPIVSLTNVDGNCLVTDYDGSVTLLKITP